MTEDDKQLIKYLTSLSRIDCSEEEEETLLHDLKSMIHYVDSLKEVDTENIKPCNHVLSEISNVFREDVTGKTLKSKQFLDNSPEQIGGMVRVPTVINKK